MVGPSWVGDMVMAQALYRELKQREPDRDIDVLAPGWSAPVIARMPQVRRTVELPVAHGELALRRRWRVAGALAATGYARAIVLPRSLKAALVPWLAGIPVRTGYRGEFRYGVINDIRPFDAVVLDQTVKRFVALAPDSSTEPPPVADPPAPSLRVDAANQTQLAARFEVPGGRPLAALMPGAEYGEAKRWPTDRFAELARRLVRDGWAVVVLGSARERPLGEQIQARAAHPLVRSLCGDTTLGDAVDLLALARVAVSNDSGLMHIAAAVDTHVIAIYGSSSPAFTPPLTERRTVIHLDLECSPCWQRSCPLSHLNCLRGIDVETVHAAVAAADGGAGAASGIGAGEAWQ